MTTTLAVTIAGWVWVLAGIGLLACTILLINDGVDDLKTFLIFAAGAVGVIGLLVMGLRFVGFPGVALVVWRIVSLTYLLSSVVLLAKSERSFSARAAGTLNVVLGFLLFGGASVATGFASEPAPRALPLSTTIITIDGIRLWHGLALGMLALGTLTFLILFVRMVERGVSPQVESNWGGIGGGMGGWRLSTSLTYLAAAAVFGVILAVLVYSLESSAGAEKNRDTNRTTTASPPKGPHTP
jgi:hypothetical protein